MLETPSASKLAETVTPTTGTEDGPVTVILRRKAQPGQEQSFETWLEGITRTAQTFAGHQGVTIMRPTSPANPEYVVIFRFNTYDNLRTWEESAVRAQWIEQGKTLFASDLEREKVLDDAFWYTPESVIQAATPTGKPPAFRQPPRYKMAIVTMLAIYPLIALAIPLGAVVPGLSALPFLLRLAVTVIIIGLLMSYLVMPFMTRLFAGWLFPRPR